jgi:alanine racemase
VVIIGAQGDGPGARLDAREMAAAIGTIPWEVVARIGTRIERRYD